MERSLNHCFTTWLNPHNKRGKIQKKRKRREKKWWVRLSRNLMDLNWRLCFPALLRGVRNLVSTSPRLESGCWSDIPCYPCSGHSRACSVRCCGHLPDYPAGYIFIESILFISCLQRFTLRLNSGALTMADEVNPILLTAPLPIFSLFGRLPLSAADFFSRADNKVVPSMKKNICMCQVRLFLLIGINRPTSLCYHTGELIPGKMFFSFSAL